MGLVIYSNAGGDGDLLLAKSSLPCKSISAKEKDKAVHLTWEDPDSPEDTTLYSEWASTRIVRKEGGFPVDENDGIVVVTSVIKNEYKDTPYVDSGLTNGTTYYYRAFTCSVDEVVNTADMVQDSATPHPFKIMTVVINLNDSNPATCGSYKDNAVGMPVGKTQEAITAWQEFFGYKPCLFKDGKVVGYLNPNDYTKFEDGTSADTESGESGYVMVEFPRRGVKIRKSGKILTVSMTDDPDNSEFTYYAHSRGTDRRDYFYIGAYVGYLKYFSNTQKLTSISKAYLRLQSETLAKYREFAHANGPGYEVMTFYQYIYIQVMYLLNFRGNLDSQSCVGIGLEDNLNLINTGACNTNGLMYGDTTKLGHMKLFGLENLWGYSKTMLEGCICDCDTGNIYLATDGFNDEYSGYENIGKLYPNELLYGFVSDVNASDKLGFLPSAFDGSESTYFCDYVRIWFQSGYKRKEICTIGSYVSHPTTEMKYWGLFAVEFISIGDEAYNIPVRLSYY